MKLTKKILSIVLAVCLLLGTVAIAANAAGLTEYTGSELSYRIEADKTEVKPGETVTFSVYMTTNYYTGSAGGEFFLWDSSVFESMEYEVLNFASTFTMTPNTAPPANMYPSTHSADKYSGVLFSRSLKVGATVTQVVTDDLIYTITLKVKDDAVPGTKAVFEMPAGSVKSPDLNTRKGVIYQVLSTSSAGIVDYAYSYCESVDLSAASVTVTVASDVEYCDYAALETAVAKLPALAEEYYDAAEYKAWTDAKAAGQALLEADPLEKSDENQKTIDDAAQLVEDTFAALDARYLSLDKLNAAVDACDEIDPADKDYYVAEDYEAWEKALADAKAAQAVYSTDDPATKQAEVNAIADALTAAYSKLTAAYVDLTKLNNTVDACDTPEYEEAVYDAQLWEAWEAALAAAKEAQTTYATAPATQQATVDGIADALQAAYDALVPDVVDLSDLEKAVAESVPEYPADYYDADEFAAYESAREAANNGLANYAGAANTAENQAAVAKLASDLRDAYAELDARFVDVAPIIEALAECVPAYSEEYYDAVAWANYEAAVAAATTVLDGYKTMADTQEYRDDVAEAAQAIRDAYAALVPVFVSYEKLEQALVDYATPEHPEFYYTPDSWKEYVDAKAAAVDANENRPSPLPAATEANQAEVDTYATALEDAYKALTPVGGAHVISVTPLQEVYDVDDTINLSILVDCVATKVQIIRANGATATYPRDHASVVSITDNGDGSETWVISRRIYEKEYTEYAKARVGKVWDTGVVAFDLECTGEDYSVKSLEITLDGEEVTNVLDTDLVTTTIVTGPAATKVRMVEASTGETITLTSPAYVNEDGTKVWILVRQFRMIKTYELDVCSKSKTSAMTDSGIDFTLTVSTVVESQLPSTGDAADAVYEASVAKKRIVKGNAQVFNITTDIAAKAVRLIDENGNVFYTVKQVTSTDTENASAIWTFEVPCRSIGDYSYTVEARYGSTWIANEEITLDFTVVY